MMDDPNITIEEYIRLEKEKAQKHRKVFNWETAKYGKIWYDEDIYDLRSVESEFPAIAFNNKVSSEKTLSREPTVSSLNDEIDFRVLFDDSDDEDYTVIFEKNSFSYKKISTNDLKTDSENDNEKVMPSLPSPEPTISYLNDLDFFKEFENEFPAIVYNDAQTSKSDLLAEPILSPQHIDEFDLNDETSLSEYDEEEQNILYFNDLFPFNIIRPNDLKLEKDNDGNDIDIIQSSKDMAPLPPRNQRHLWLRYQNLAERIRMVYTRDDGQEVFVSHAWRRLFGIRSPLVQEFILEFFSTCRIGDEMGLDVAGTLCFQMGGARRSMTWRQFILALGLHTAEEMAEDGFGAYWLGSERLIPYKGDLSDYWDEISSGMDFLRGAPSYTYIRDPVQRLCHRLISYSISRMGQAPEKVTATDLFYLCSTDPRVANIPYLLAQYLFMHTNGRKSGARLSGGHFIRHLAHHFGLMSDDGLRGLSVVARELLLIDLGELVKLNICMDDETRFKNLIKRVPHHCLDLWSLTQLFYDHVDDYTRMDLDFVADENLRELSGEEAWEAIENFAQGQKEWDNPPNIISEQEVANLKAQEKRLFGNEDVWVKMHRGIACDNVENLDPQSTPQVLPSFEEYTPLVTCPKKVEETLGTSVEVEPLDETQLEDLGLNTCNHDTPLSNREVPSFDKPEPQLNTLPNCLSLDISLGEESSPEPPIKPHSPDSFRMKEVDSLTINTPPLPYMASSLPKDTYCYYRPCIDDPKKH
ncbi:hypothetical protein Tco_0273327 [Tanacetum coccineum]